jgi:hypothetical protein
VLRLSLAEASAQTPAVLLGLQRTIQKEHEARLNIAAEARTLRAEQDWQEIGQAITLPYLFPPSLAEALKVRCRYYLLMHHQRPCRSWRQWLAS